MKTVMTGNGPRSFKSSGLDGLEVPFSSIPVIDFEPILSDDPAERMKVGLAVRKACTEVGFFYATGHGVPQEVINATLGAAKEFFNKPLDEKLKVNIANSPNMRGYTELLGENTAKENFGDVHEGFDLALDLPADDPDVIAGVYGYGPNQWPEGMPEFRKTLLDYQKEILDFGQRIFQAFALALELDEDFFVPFTTKPMAHMRVLSYPNQEVDSLDESQIGIGPHSDYECFTVLYTDETPALQVLNCAGEWVQAPPIKDAFVVNVGDLMARWTNDYFASTMHRAINTSGRQRYSIPFFYGTNSEATIEVLPSCQGPDWPPRYEPIKSSDYIRSRFDDTYFHRFNDAI